MDNIQQVIKSEDIEKNAELGNGAFATVYRGTWTTNTDDIPVALKCMSSKDISLESESVQREMNLRNLDHPNIIKYYGVCELDGRVTLVLELSPDGALDEWIFQKKRSTVGSPGHDVQVLIWFTQCSKGLDYLHSQHVPIIHRDIKPGNMLLFNGGEILKITDMGLSRVVGEESMTATQGTMKYMSPEAMTTGHYGSEADVFSFGISLFAILTCQKPYANMFDHISNQYRQMQKIQEKVSSGVRPGPVPDQPAGIASVITKCWHQEPHKRPTMKAVAGVLTKIREIIDF